MNGHSKIPGVVTSIEGRRWWARLLTDGGEYEAEMIEPRPMDASLGSYFTIHKSRRGPAYLYWIRTTLTKRQLKKARIEARQLMELFDGPGRE